MELQKTLHYSSQAAKCDETTVITFDQPLYWKALTIIRSQPTDNALKDVGGGPRVVVSTAAFHARVRFPVSVYKRACTSSHVLGMFSNCFMFEY